MNMIAAVTFDWGVGCDGGLLLSIPEDMKFFRSVTMGKTIVMGRATLESFPGGKPLKGRENIVLSTNPDFRPEGVVTAGSFDEAARIIKTYPPEDVFIIGGASVYSLFLPYCSRAYITKMDVLLKADRFIPDLDSLDGWRVDKESEKKEYEGTKYRFLEYVNDNVQPL